MTSTREELVREMRRAGFSSAAIDAAWPSWWTDDADGSPSSRAELRFALSRRLGLAPKPLLGERVEFFWDDAARFKHLRVHQAQEQSAIASFGISLGRDLISATPKPDGFDWQSTTALQLRRSIIKNRPFVDLQSLVAASWSFGIPVVYLNVVPLETKSMHAMVVRYQDRFAILLARNTRYPAMLAFTIAHELGHVLLGHIGDSLALVDLENPAENRDDDIQEQEADVFALNLLTGTSNPIIEPDRVEFNAPTLARAAIEASSQHQVEPGMIALSLAYRDGSWARTMSALKFIYGGNVELPDAINRLARKSLEWDKLSSEAADYLEKIMAIRDA
jgi:hypothetical protein